MLVSIGADRVLRLWDSFRGTLLRECFTGHKSGETVAAMCCSSDASCLVTGDTMGFIKVILAI